MNALDSRFANLDVRLLVALRMRGHTPASERAVARFSRLGEHGALWFAIGVLGAVRDSQRAGSWRRASGSVARAYVLNSALKLAVRRRRPQLPGLPPLTGTPTGLSFPSAHAATSFAGALAYTRLGAPPVPLYALAAGLALSRLYLGVHYPSDALAGAVLGTAVAARAGGARCAVGAAGR